MASNSIGEIFRFTSYGESHGPEIGGIIDGCPPGLDLDLSKIQNELNRRRPGQTSFTTSRVEKDEFVLSSGLYQGKTTGHPIGFRIENNDQRSQDYSELQELYRPSHADFTYEHKYGIRDPFGGGRASARITASWVVAGSVARQLLAAHTDLDISVYVSSIHEFKMNERTQFYARDVVDSSPLRCPEPELSARMEKAVSRARENGDSLGGIITCVVRNCPIGLGDPVFGKLHARLAHAMMSINAVKGFEIGEGFNSSALKGSENNDSFAIKNEKITTSSNHSGGIQGGISNGEDIVFHIAFKPPSTISKTQETVDKEGNPVHFSGTGRHDPVVVPRAVPIVEALTCLILADAWLLHKSQKF